MKYTAHPLPACCLDWLQLLWTARALYSEKQSKSLIHFGLAPLLVDREGQWPDGLLALWMLLRATDRVSSFIAPERSFVLSVGIQRFCTYIFASSCFGLQSEIVRASNNWQGLNVFLNFTTINLKPCLGHILLWESDIINSLSSPPINCTYTQTQKRLQSAYEPPTTNCSTLYSSVNLSF